jgi:hypothetical protein
MPQPFEVDDYNSSLFNGLSGFWQRFFRDTKDLQAFYKASEQYLGQVYLDLLGSVLSTGIVDTPVFNKEYWKLFLIKENELSFVAGDTVLDDKYKYDMPGSAVSLVLLQNSVFDPSVTFERDVDFTLKDDDGFIYFNRDIFNEVTDTHLDMLVPLSGVAWRYSNIQVGNRLLDYSFSTGNWERDTSVRKGDTLNILAYRGVLVKEGYAGQFIVSGPVAFTIAGDSGKTFDETHVGDIIEVYSSSDPTLVGYYIIDRRHGSDVTTVYLPDGSTFGVSTLWNLPTSTSSADLKWRHYKAIYFDASEELYEIDYFDGAAIIGNYNTPLPLGYVSPLVYAVTRKNYEYTGSVGITNYDPSSATYGATDLGVKHLVPGTVKVYASRVDGYQVTEGIDYAVDYLNGIIRPLPYVNNMTTSAINGSFSMSAHVFRVVRYPYYASGIELDPIQDIGSTIEITESTHYPIGIYTITSIDASYSPRYSLTLTDSSGVILPINTTESGVHWTYRKRLDAPYWNPASLVRSATYEFRSEVFLSAGGRIEELTNNNVRELGLWVPEVLVDRFTLYNNYGYLLNRFSASSETYKNFLRGIMYLYTSGPKLYVVEAALNVAAGYPVIRSDGEVFTGYNNGVISSGSDGVITDGATKVFTSASATFTDADIGGWLVISNSINEANQGKFKIESVTDDHTAVLNSEFPMVIETGLGWLVSWDYAKTITTQSTQGTNRTYSFPLNIPLRADLEDASNYNKLTFESFEILTTAFIVTDYLEDPEWWHDKFIPSILWPNTTADRRFATTKLYASLIDPEDALCVDDPGAYLDADDTGLVLAPTDGIGNPVDIYRHGTAFCLMDQYLKFHMFFVDIDYRVDLTMQFRDDIANIIIIVKPSYTYPYIESGDIFIDSQELFDTLSLIPGLDFSGIDGLTFANCELSLDQPYNLDDFYRYEVYDGASQALASPPAAPFTLAIGVGHRLVQCAIHATVDSVDVLEGVDYTIDLDPESVTHGLVTPLTSWDAAADITFTARAVVLVNEDDGTPDTTIGFTPLMLDGLEPGYVRYTLEAPYNRVEFIERALGISIDTNYPVGVPYTYL